MVENIACGRSLSASELSFTWESPGSPQDNLLEYQIEVKGLHHSASTRNVVQFSVAGFTTKMRVATITQGLSKD